MIRDTEIKKRLSEAIKLSGMTQKQIADKLGVCQQLISCYINEKKMPALDTFANLCKILDVDAHYILCQE